MRDCSGSVSYTHLDVYKRQDEDLGKFYVENGFREDLDALPDSVYALLDYAKIGKQMREDEALSLKHISAGPHSAATASRNSHACSFNASMSMSS